MLEFPFRYSDKTLLQEIVPGVSWLRMPLPFRPLSVNIWVLKDGDSCTVIDAGASTSATREIWCKAVAQGTVNRLIVTHSHPDHVGNAGWLQQKFGISLWMSRSEWLLARMIQQQHRIDAKNERFSFYSQCGVPQPYLSHYGEGDRAYDYVFAVPPTYQRMKNGDEIRIGGDLWQVIVGEGHSPEHVSLHCAERRLLLSGDHILGRIVPTIMVSPYEPEGDPIGRYLESLEKFESLHPKTIVLAAHGPPFVGIASRITSLKAFYVEKSRRLRELCCRPMTVTDCMDEALRPEADLSRLHLVLMETFAQLNALVAQGELNRHLVDGLWTFEPTRSQSGTAGRDSKYSHFENTADRPVGTP